MQNQILMPLATALWLKLNTQLTIDQIAEFCKLPPLKVIALGKEDKMTPYNPTVITLTKEEIDRCEKDPTEKLQAKYYKVENKGRKYIGPFEKQKLPGIIAWLVTHDRPFNKKKLAKIFSTTGKYIEKICSNLSRQTPLHPVQSGLLSERELKEITENNS